MVPGLDEIPGSGDNSEGPEALRSADLEIGATRVSRNCGLRGFVENADQLDARRWSWARWLMSWPAMVSTMVWKVMVPRSG